MKARDIATLGRALRRYREDSGESSKDFASRTGLAASYLSEIETGKRRITPQFLGKVALALGKEPDEFTRILENLHPGFTTEPEHPENPSIVREEFAYNTPRISPPVPPDDMQMLAEHLVARMAPAERADFLRQMTESAITGDHIASAAARAMLLLIRKFSV